jgi:hypothetical protein
MSGAQTDASHLQRGALEKSLDARWLHTKRSHDWIREPRKGISLVFAQRNAKRYVKLTQRAARNNGGGEKLAS